MSLDCPEGVGHLEGVADTTEELVEK